MVLLQITITITWRRRDAHVLECTRFCEYLIRGHNIIDIGFSYFLNAVAFGAVHYNRAQTKLSVFTINNPTVYLYLENKPSFSFQREVSPIRVRYDNVHYSWQEC